MVGVWVGVGVGVWVGDGVAVDVGTAVAVSSGSGVFVGGISTTSSGGTAVAVQPAMNKKAAMMSMISVVFRKVFMIFLPEYLGWLAGMTSQCPGKDL